MIKTISKYLGIGFLLGIGISASDWIYFQMTKDSKLVFIDEVKEQILELRNDFYVEGFETVFDNPKDYRPNMGLSVNLERSKLMQTGIQVSGVVSNNGVDIWNSAFLEIEAFDGEG